jgi:hypothetical protein
LRRRRKEEDILLQPCKITWPKGKDYFSRKAKTISVLNLSAPTKEGRK